VFANVLHYLIVLHYNIFYLFL